MSTIPFAEAGVSEVIARVTYQMVAIDYKHNPERYSVPNDGVYQLSVQHRTYESTFLHTALYGLAAYLKANRGKALQWRDEIIYRSRYHMAAARAGRPWTKSPTPVLLTGGSDREHLDILSAPVQRPSGPKGKRGRKNAY